MNLDLESVSARSVNPHEMLGTLKCFLLEAIEAGDLQSLKTVVPDMLALQGRKSAEQKIVYYGDVHNALEELCLAGILKYGASGTITRWLAEQVDTHKLQKARSKPLKDNSIVQR